MEDGNMNDLLTQIGTRIFQRRKQLRFTQEELAERAHVTPQTISAAELGKKALRPENIIGVCAALNISTDYLLLGSVTPQDTSKLSSKISLLSSVHYKYLEDIVDSYIAAVSATKSSQTEGS